MQSIRRATKKHRKVLLGVVILLMLGLVGSFATWNAASRATDSGGSGGESTLAQQISYYEDYLDNMAKEQGGEADYSSSMTLAGSYLDLSYLYRTKADEDISAAENAAAIAAEANPDAEPVDTSGAGVASQEASMAAALQSQFYYQRAWDTAPTELNDLARADIKAGLAASREAQDDLEGALTFMAEAYELNPGNTQYLVAQASLLDTLGRPEEALEKYNIAAELYPENTQLMVQRAALYAQLDQAEEAQELYLQACELAPQDLSIAYAYASFLFSFENPEAGLDVLRAFRASLPEGDAKIPDADSAIANLAMWADFFSSISEGGETETEGGEETPAEETPVE